MSTNEPFLAMIYRLTVVMVPYVYVDYILCSCNCTTKPKKRDEGVSAAAPASYSKRDKFQTKRLRMKPNRHESQHFYDGKLRVVRPRENPHSF